MLELTTKADDRSRCLQSSDRCFLSETNYLDYHRRLPVAANYNKPFAAVGGARA